MKDLGLQETVDVEAVRAVFPYGKVFVELVDGGLRAGSCIAIADLGALPLFAFYCLPVVQVAVGWVFVSTSSQSKDILGKATSAFHIPQAGS